MSEATIVRMEERKRRIEGGRYEVVAVERVREASEGRSEIMWDGGRCCVVGIDPDLLSEGDRVRLFTDGAGSRIHGCDWWDGDGWEPVEYRSEADIAARHADRVWKQRCEKAVQFAENREERDERVEALPQVFRDRLLRFRRNNPNFRIEYEPYELTCCEEAVAIAEWAREERPDAPLSLVEEAVEAEWEERREMYKPRHDDHSGNTMGVAWRLAHQYLDNPELVEFRHGAMAVLVGCEEYGCPPPSEEDWRLTLPESLSGEADPDDQ